MGRRKITITKIQDERLKNITFNKRKNGLIKKAAELAMLCDVKLVLIFNDLSGNLIKFTSVDPSNVFSFFQNFDSKNIFEFTSEDYPEFFKVNHYKKKETSSSLNKRRNQQLNNSDHEQDENLSQIEEEEDQAAAIPKQINQDETIKQLAMKSSYQSHQHLNESQLLLHDIQNEKQMKQSNNSQKAEFNSQLKQSYEVKLAKSQGEQALNTILGKDSKIMSNLKTSRNFENDMNFFKSLTDEVQENTEVKLKQTTEENENKQQRIGEPIQPNFDLLESIFGSQNMQGSNRNQQNNNQMKNLSQLMNPQSLLTLSNLYNQQSSVTEQEEQQQQHQQKQDMISPRNIAELNYKSFQDYQKNIQESINYKQWQESVGYKNIQESMQLKHLQESLQSGVGGAFKGLGDSFGFNKNLLDTIYQENIFYNKKNENDDFISKMQSLQPEQYHETIKRIHSFTKNQNFSGATTTRDGQPKSMNLLFNNLDSSIPFQDQFNQKNITSPLLKGFNESAVVDDDSQKKLLFKIVKENSNSQNFKEFKVSNNEINQQNLVKEQILMQQQQQQQQQSIELPKESGSENQKKIKQQKKKILDQQN